MDAQNLSGRDAGKLRRRRAIIAAAHRIIADEGDAALTMRRLATEAGLSVPTAYNLFGSKEAVLRAVMDEDLKSVDDRFLELADRPALARIFDMIDVRFEAYRDQPVYYRSLLRSLYLARESESDHGIWIVYTSYGRDMIREAVEAGCLDPRHRGLLERSLVRIYHSAVIEWISGEIALATAHRDVGLSVATMLGGFATGGHGLTIAGIARRYELMPSE